ncbi:hypothetical protein [Paraburkholderia domus]|uniref:Uncharacterized protein n=1 Tax=Paraburkholderia domus TaxID=2793075 RepID=A0A9N8MJB6_9BURK|nr:hypothetical protein [Paraburkholderia domus]MBK5163804.1 hypothetical protein [Burkholderia sp. R-70211]CAE6858397.1 hypothetical protein R70211_00308 [Paraburkholderia domus]
MSDPTDDKKTTAPGLENIGLEINDDEQLVSDADDEEYSDEFEFDPKVPSTRELLREKSQLLALEKLSPEDLDAWIDAIQETLKVGLIIDGQHRVSGTKAQKVLFAVSALPEAAWPELAFQFIVLNSTARAVKESLLINIIGTSLDPEELTTVEKRLVDSGVPVPLYQGVMRLHEDPESPFYGMLRFGIADKAPIDAKAAKSKIAAYWHRCKVYPLVAHLIPGETKKEKMQNWVAQGIWYDYLKVFWNVAKARYADTGLWLPTTESDGVTPTSRLLRTTVLNLVQNAVIESMFKALETEINNDPESVKDMKALLPDINAFQKRCEMYFKRLLPEFFSEWGPASKGLDGSRGPRDEFVKAIRQVIESHKSVAELKSQTSGSIIFRLV